MSYDDKSFMARGFRVRHKYKRRRGCYGVCERCGVKRRSTSSGWEYQVPPERLGMKSWTTSNPPCVKRETGDAYASRNQARSEVGGRLATARTIRRALSARRGVLRRSQKRVGVRAGVGRCTKQGAQAMKLNCTTDKYEDLYARWLVDPGKLLKLGGLQPGERVIDLCGGTGIVGKTARDWGASYVVVLDLNPHIRVQSDGQVQSRYGNAEEVDEWIGGLPFDLVVCRQAIGYLDIEKTARAVANKLGPGGRFVFNTFQKPKFALKSYRFDGTRFFEASGFFGRTVLHVQASPRIGFNVTKFRWHREDDLDRALRPYFEIVKSSTEKSLYYVCTKRDPS